MARATGEGWEPLLPAPRDALALEAGGSADGLRLVRLARLPNDAAEETTDLDERCPGLALVGPAERLKAKPAAGVPYWNWTHYRSWLQSPDRLETEWSRADLGYDHPPIEHRTGVQIEAQSQTARDGALFQVEHRRYQGRPAGATGHSLADVQRLALLATAESSEIRGAVVPFAGERRLVALRSVDQTVPELPEEVLAGILAHRRARAILVTPAHFTQGWLPRWLVESPEGVRVHLKAAAVGRPEVVSGWDLLRSRPKPTRRLVPAGSVYFLELEGADAAVEAWLRQRWWRAVSDDEQARRDGFGVCVFGVDPSASGDGTEA